MTDEHIDQLFADLRASLDVEPSAGFAAGVRARTAAAPAPRRVAFFWPALAMAAGIVIVAAIVVTSRGSSAPVAPASAPAIAAAASAPASRAASAVPESPVTPVTPEAPAGPRAARNTLARATTPASASVTSLEVITNQGDVLRAIWRRAGSRDGTLREAEAERATETTAGPVTEPMQAIVLTPVTIDPIVVSTLGGAAPGGATTPNGSTIRRADVGRN